MGLRSLSCALALALLSAPAAAQETERAPGEHVHDGLYVRIGLGATMVRDSFESGEGNALFSETSGTITGFGTAQQLAIGGAIAPGFILAGGVVTDIAWTASVEVDGGESESRDSYAMFTMGPLIDYYFDPEAGLHAMLGGGYGVTSGAEPEGSDGGASTGFGLYAGFGNEWWVSEQWSIGGLLRVHYVRATETLSLLLIDSFDIRHEALGVSLMFSSTYN